MIEENATELQQINIATAEKVYRMTSVLNVPSGQIRTEIGADGIYILFDCDCQDALPFCKASCCGLPGTYVMPHEIPGLNEVAEKLLRTIVVYQPQERYAYQMRRDADGFCSCLNRDKRLCEIYDERPKVCQDFHCSKGVNRGWKFVLAKQHEYMH